MDHKVKDEYYRIYKLHKLHYQNYFGDEYYKNEVYVRLAKEIMDSYELPDILKETPAYKSFPNQLFDDMLKTNVRNKVMGNLFVPKGLFFNATLDLVGEYKKNNKLDSFILKIMPVTRGTENSPKKEKIAAAIRSWEAISSKLIRETTKDYMVAVFGKDLSKPFENIDRDRATSQIEEAKKNLKHFSEALRIAGHFSTLFDHEPSISTVINNFIEVPDMESLNKIKDCFDSINPDTFINGYFTSFMNNPCPFDVSRVSDQKYLSILETTLQLNTDDFFNSRAYQNLNKITELCFKDNIYYQHPLIPEVWEHNKDAMNRITSNIDSACLPVELKNYIREFAKNPSREAFVDTAYYIEYKLDNKLIKDKIKNSLDDDYSSVPEYWVKCHKGFSSALQVLSAFKKLAQSDMRVYGAMDSFSNINKAENEISTSYRGLRDELTLLAHDLPGSLENLFNSNLKDPNDSTIFRSLDGFFESCNSALLKITTGREASDMSKDSSFGDLAKAIVKSLSEKKIKTKNVTPEKDEVAICSKGR
ncbi:hypothetical protein [Anaerobiospirillum sp. NML120449]|uniref:hypothetical protein n=1 Tax=Anaerobiospirillum sp. NML120449 TaxID=2932817 RepID=UPI001FF29539|nr:hypothetical protein [Anaerobiospirillum sp. NML120449]MCK0525418.1 hypothetical protein [Anaerobiospirillum sp. NML120449]